MIIDNNNEISHTSQECKILILEGVLTSHTHNNGELRHFHINAIASQILAFLSSSSLDTVTLSTTETTQESSHSLFHIFST